MYQSSPLKQKSRAFSIRIIKLYQYISSNNNEYVISKQILRSGTSIGANLAESECAISKKDFLSKVYTALKECNETLYWLDLLHETQYITDKQFSSLYNNCIELRTISITPRSLSSKPLNS